jgi:hypothetical protein
MNMHRLCLTLLCLAVLPASAAQATQEPAQYELKLVHIFEGKEATHIFVIGDSGFTTVESLKGFLTTLPKGSSLRWDPGCARFGKEPLLSSEKDMEDFRAFLAQRGISLVLVPSG